MSRGLLHIVSRLAGTYRNMGLCLYNYRISTNSFLPWVVSPLNSFHGNYSIYEVKNCHNAETIWKFSHFTLSKKNSYSRKYGNYFGMEILWNKLVMLTHVSWTNMKISIKGTSYQSNQTCNSCWEWYSTLFLSRSLENGNSVTCFLERSKSWKVMLCK